MPWTDSHMHQFLVGHTAYGSSDPSGMLDIENECSVRLNRLVGEGQRLMYEYDFGDGWQHEILVEKMLPADPAARYPVCLAGKRACPPDDCGGPWGYQNMLAVLANPKHERYAETLEWLDGEFDPEAFDPDALNRRLPRIKPAPKRHGPKPVRSTKKARRSK